MVSSPTVNRPYYPVLDGLRGLAILLVVFYHNFGFINYLFFGWLGVDLFFVLSGYLITDILLREGTSGPALRRFYIRRVLRIFPLYYLSLILALLVLPSFPALQKPLQYYRENQFFLWTYLQNWLYIFKPVNNTTFLHHFWSLAVEEQFYIFWPLVIMLLRTPRRLLLFLSGLLLAVLLFRSAIWLYQLEDLAYFNLYTFSRIDGICIGCIVALLQRTHPHFLSRYRPVVVLGFAGLNFLFYFINAYFTFTFPYLALIGYTTFAMLFGLLVHEGVLQKDRFINGVFTLPVLHFFGRISYSFYVLHWPVYVLFFPAVHAAVKNALPYPSVLQQIISSAICTAAGVLISWLCYRYFERPFLKLKGKFSQPGPA